MESSNNEVSDSEENRRNQGSDIVTEEDTEENILVLEENTRKMKILRLLHSQVIHTQSIILLVVLAKQKVQNIFPSRLKNFMQAKM